MNYTVTIEDTRTGAKRKTIVEADDIAEIDDHLGLADSEGFTAEESSGVDVLMNKIFGGKPKPKEVKNFYKGMSLAIKVGGDINFGLRLTQPLAMTQAFRSAIGMVRRDLNSGTDLPTALRKHPESFLKHHVAMIAAGETSGRLPDIFRAISRSVEHNFKVGRKIKGAFAYPIVVANLSVVAMLVLGKTLLPNIIDLFHNFRQEPPLMTQLTAWLADISFQIPLIPMFLIGLPWYMFVKWETVYKIPIVASTINSLPIISQMVFKTQLASTFKALHLMLFGAVNVLDAMKIASEIPNDPDLSGAWKRIIEHVEAGEDLGTSFQIESEYFGKEGQMISGFVSLGEQQGAVKSVVEYLSDAYQDDVEELSGQLPRVIEPITYTIVGGFVLVLMIAVYLPTLQLGSAIAPS